MKKENLLFLTIIMTILAARLSILAVPDVDMQFFGVLVHHFWFGVILFIAGLSAPKKYGLAKTLFYGTGLGLMIDQLVFMLLGAGGDPEYWALPSLLGMLILAAIIYPLRKKITEAL